LDALGAAHALSWFGSDLINHTVREHFHLTGASPCVSWGLFTKGN
jgi:hypothetical protein